MVLLFLPAVRILAPILMLTSICVRLNEILCLPLWTLLSLIVKDMRLSPEVLPVMGVDTSIPGMSCITIGTPDCLKVEQIEVKILFKLIKQIY